MFSRIPDKNKQESEKIKTCKETIAFRKIIADEQCRTFRVNAGFDQRATNGDRFIWGESQCQNASKKLIDQAEECLSIQRKGLYS